MDKQPFPGNKCRKTSQTQTPVMEPFFQKVADLRINFYTTRNSRPEVFCKKVVLRNFAKFTGKHLCQSLFFNTVAGLAWNVIKKRDSGTGVFLWIFVKFVRTPFLQNTSGGCFCTMVMHGIQQRFAASHVSSEKSVFFCEHARQHALIWSAQQTNHVLSYHYLTSKFSHRIIHNMVRSHCYSRLNSSWKI